MIGTRATRWRALLGALLCCSAGGVAQTTVRVPSESGVSTGREVAAAITPVTAGVRPGGQGHVRIDLHNPDSLTHRITARLEDPSYGVFEAASNVELEPGGRARLFMPLPVLDFHAGLSLTADGGRPVHAMMIPTSSDQPQGLSVLLVAGAGADATGWRATLERRIKAMPSTSTSLGSDPRELSIFESLLPADLPPDWAMIDGFDLVVVDGRAEGLDATAQRPLRDYLRAGGRVLVTASDRLPAGPLRDAIAQGGLSQGFGLALAIAGSGLPAATLSASDERALSGWLDRADGALAAIVRPTSGPLPAALYAALEIPGLGDVPLRAFFVIIVLFAIAVGPLNYLYFRRRRRLTMLLLTVPALGLATTLLLLGYGVVAEGLGVRGALRSYTILDQAEHEAATWSGRTLYAGIAPNRIVTRPGTCLKSLELLNGRFNWRAVRSDRRMQFRPDGWIDGALLPSRTPSTFGVVNLGPERARLRFERHADGALAVLASPDFAPASGEGMLLLRDFSGAYWLQSADGRLTGCDADAAERAVQTIVDTTFAGLDFDSTWRYALQLDETGESEGPVTRLLGACDAEATLAPGHYLMLLGTPSPIVDDLGLAGDIARREVVLGRLAAEDIVD